MSELISIAETRRMFAQRGRGAMHIQTWKTLVKRGEFPPPVRLGKREYYTPEIPDGYRAKLSAPMPPAPKRSASKRLSAEERIARNFAKARKRIGG